MIPPCLQILMMTNDEEVVYAAIIAVAEAKARQYKETIEPGDKDAISPVGHMGDDASTLAGMLVAEEKKILKDLKLQLMTEVSEVQLTTVKGSRSSGIVKFTSTGTKLDDWKRV